MSLMFMKQSLQVKNNRIEYIDIAKGIGILLVVFGHSSLVLHVENVWIHSFHMPLFFIIAGMCFNESKYSFADFFKRRARQILAPCLFFTAVIASVEIAIGTRQWDSLLHGVPHALWFLPVLFISQIVVDAAWLILQKLVCRLAFVMLCLMAWWGISNSLPLPYTAQAIPAATAFLGIGNMIASQETKWPAAKEFVLCLVASIISVYILKSRLNLYENLLVHPVIATVAAIMGSCLVLAFSKLIENKRLERIKYGLVYLGKNSLTMMAIHQFFFYLGRAYVKPYMTFTPPYGVR